MRNPKIQGRVIDLRGVFDADAMLELERFADRRPGETIEVISDCAEFGLGLLRWCGEGYGKIESIRGVGRGDHYLLQLPTRDECAQIGLARPS
jgi:hypothetical protein